MTDNDTHDSTNGQTAAADGVPEREATGASSDLESDGGSVASAGRAHADTDYLNSEVNLLKPSTPFMRDHLRIIWTGFAIWAVIVFGPVTATVLAPDVMTTTMPVIGFPLHYFLVAIGAPGGALILAFWYARKRDELDDKYGIEHGGDGA
jgi:putative solute:sodium symporter small subunit